jgi:hypothetical protein
MVSFLLQHALELEEKADDLPDPWPESVHLERSRITQGIIMEIQNNN